MMRIAKPSRVSIGLALIAFSNFALAFSCTITPDYTITHAGESVALSATCTSNAVKINWKADGNTLTGGEVTASPAVPGGTPIHFQTPRSLTGGATYTSHAVTITVTDDTVTPATVTSAPVTIVVAPGPSVAVTKNGTGTGTVTSSPAGIDCGTACISRFPIASGVSLIPTPGANSVFSGWSTDCSGAGACSLTMHGDRVVAANFTTAVTGICNSTTIATASVTPPSSTPSSNLCTSGTPSVSTPTAAAYPWTCAGNSGSPVTCSAPRRYNVTTSGSGTGGTFSASRAVTYGQTTAITVSPAAGYAATMGGTCSGSPSTLSAAGTYTTNPVIGACSVTVTFSNAPTVGVCNAATASTATLVAPSASPTTNLCSVGTPTVGTATVGTFPWTCSGNTGSPTACSAPRKYTVTTSASAGGAISASTDVTYNQTTSITVTPTSGYTATMGGTCGGSPTTFSSAGTYTTSPIVGACSVTATFSNTPVSNTDPGKWTGFWQPPGTTNIWVADQTSTQGAGSFTFIPGCLNQQSTSGSQVGCALSTSYGGASFAQGNIISVRYTSATIVNTFAAFTLKGNNGGNLDGSMSMWLSATPPGTAGGNYADASATCRVTTPDGTPPAIYTHANQCPIQANTAYYLNFQSNYACGGSTCRFIIEEGADLY